MSKTKSSPKEPFGEVVRELPPPIARRRIDFQRLIDLVVGVGEIDLERQVAGKRTAVDVQVGLETRSSNSRSRQHSGRP